MNGKNDKKSRAGEKKTCPIPRPKLMRIYAMWMAVGGGNHTDCVCLSTQRTHTYRGVSGRMTGHYNNNMYAGTRTLYINNIICTMVIRRPLRQALVVILYVYMPAHVMERRYLWAFWVCAAAAAATCRVRYLN